MTRSMIPARNLLRRHCDTYGGAFCFGGEDGGNDDEETTHFDVIKKLSDLSSITATNCMADRTVVQTPGGGADEEEEEEGGASSGWKNWLQLGLTTTSRQPTSSTARTAPVVRREPPLELNLFVNRPQQQEPSRLPGAVNTNPSFLAEMPSIQSSMQMALPLGILNPNLLIGGNNPMLSPPVDRLAMQEFMARQNTCQSGSNGSTSAAVGGVGGMRAINPPFRMPQTGIWFSLLAAQAQGIEPILPQISKSYLRIKDGRMTVRLLMKYLASKLGMEDESEVEMACRGQVLDPSLTLQHVRDYIWCFREADAAAAAAAAAVTAVALFPDSSATHHIMTLHYYSRR